MISVSTSAEYIVSTVSIGGDYDGDPPNRIPADQIEITGGGGRLAAIEGSMTTASDLAGTAASIH